MGLIVADITAFRKKLKGVAKDRSDSGTYVLFEVRNIALPLDKVECVEKHKMWREDDLLLWQGDQVQE